MEIIIQANETDNWNLSLILFKFESVAMKESGNLFWSWRSAVPWQRVTTTNAGSNCIHLEPDYKLQCPLLLPSVFTCHWGKKWYTNWEWDFFFSERGCHDPNGCDTPNITYWNTNCQVESFSRWELREMIRSRKEMVRSWNGVLSF